MATILKELFGSNNQSITCTITSLANNGQRGSTAIDNSTNLYIDALVQITLRTAGASTSSTGYVNVYAYGTANGSTYTDGVSGTDGAVTLTSPPNVFLIGVVNAVANSTTYVGGPFSVAKAFSGILPQSWGIIVENKTGATLDASIGSCIYQGVYNQGE